MTPVGGGVEAESAAPIEEVEDAGRIAARALQSKDTEKLVGRADDFIHARLQGVHMGGGSERRLVVEAAAAGEIGKRIEGEQSLRLRTDEAGRDDVAGEGLAGSGIEQRFGYLGKIAGAFGGGGHEGGLRGFRAIARPLVIQKDVGGVE